MKNIVTILKTLLLLSLVVPTLIQGQQEFGKITLPLGRVQIQKKGTGPFKKAMPRTPVFEKDVIKTLAKQPWSCVELCGAPWSPWAGRSWSSVECWGNLGNQRFQEY